MLGKHSKGAREPRQTSSVLGNGNTAVRVEKQSITIASLAEPAMDWHPSSQERGDDLLGKELTCVASFFIWAGGTS